VVLDAKALPKPVHDRWQMSTDQTTWTDLPESFLTNSIVEGMAPATVYSFRLKTMTRSASRVGVAVARPYDGAAGVSAQTSVPRVRAIGL
jgi:hypothetical protein